MQKNWEYLHLLFFKIHHLKIWHLNIQYTIEELHNIHGVGEGKAKRYGDDFVDLIKRYVDENEIDRIEDMVIKSTGSNSS